MIAIEKEEQIGTEQKPFLPKVIMSSHEDEPSFDRGDLDNYPIRVHPDEPLPKTDETRSSVRRDYDQFESRLFGQGGPELQVDGLNKEQFFRTNFTEIENIISAINQRYQLQGGLELSAVEVLAVTNAEMGLKSGGIIDPKHDHKAGEFGLLPLSTIHKAVTGNDAPNPHGLYRPTINFQEFLLYLGGLKVFGPYKKIYSFQGIPGFLRRQAHTAGAVVHGYFYSPNYRPKTSKPANGNILSVIANDLDLGEFMSKSTFKAAWAVKTRMKNLEAGMDLAELIQSQNTPAPVSPPPIPIVPPQPPADLPTPGPVDLPSVTSTTTLPADHSEEEEADVFPGDLIELSESEGATRGIVSDEDDYIPEIFEDPQYAPETRGGNVSWASDLKSPCYSHLLVGDADNVEVENRFTVTKDVFEFLIQANHFAPKGKNDIIAFGIRGGNSGR